MDREVVFIKIGDADLDFQLFCIWVCRYTTYMYFGSPGYLGIVYLSATSTDFLVLLYLGMET